MKKKFEPTKLFDVIKIRARVFQTVEIFKWKISFLFSFLFFLLTMPRVSVYFSHFLHKLKLPPQIINIFHFFVPSVKKFPIFSIFQSFNILLMGPSCPAKFQQNAGRGFDVAKIFQQMNKISAGRNRKTFNSKYFQCRSDFHTNGRIFHWFSGNKKWKIEQKLALNHRQILTMKKTEAKLKQTNFHSLVTKTKTAQKNCIGPF